MKKKCLQVIHQLTVKALCPVSDQVDCYELFVRAGRLVKVEDILAATAGFNQQKIFQEDLTQALAKALGCEVETRGWHSGVRTTVICE